MRHEVVVHFKHHMPTRHDVVIQAGELLHLEPSPGPAPPGAREVRITGDHSAVIYLDGVRCGRGEVARPLMPGTYHVTWRWWNGVTTERHIVVRRGPGVQRVEAAFSAARGARSAGT